MLGVKLTILTKIYQVHMAIGYHLKFSKNNQVTNQMYLSPSPKSLHLKYRHHQTVSAQCTPWNDLRTVKLIYHEDDELPSVKNQRGYKGEKELQHKQ